MVQVEQARVALWGLAGWYAGQAYDEALNGNLFNDGQWENGLLLAICLTTYFYLRHHDRARKKGSHP